jgi:hypothetical protein
LNICNGVVEYGVEIQLDKLRVNLFFSTIEEASGWRMERSPFLHFATYY